MADAAERKLSARALADRTVKAAHAHQAHHTATTQAARQRAEQVAAARAGRPEQGAANEPADK